MELSLAKACRRKIEMAAGAQSRNDTPLWSGSGGGRARSPRRSAAPDRRPMLRSLKSHPLSTERALVDKITQMIP
jgi:hypothetical protein